MIDAAVLLELTALGLSAEQYAGVLAVIAKTSRGDAGVTLAKSKGAERTRRWREKRDAAAASPSDDSVTPASPPVTNPSPSDAVGSRARVEDKLLFSEIEPQTEVLERKNKSGGDARDARAFDAFWAMFPNKVGKADAFKAFERAVKRVDLETLMAGLARYVVKTDDRPWCNPSTWLNQDRWADQPAPQASPPRSRGGSGRGIGAIMDNLRQEIEDEQQRTSGPQGGNREPVGLLPFAGR